MQLHEVEVDILGDPAHLFRGLIDEHAHDLGPHEELVDDGLGLLGRDAAVRVAEVKTDEVGARLDGRLGRLQVADAADLHPNHLGR